MRQQRSGLLHVQIYHYLLWWIVITGAVALPASSLDNAFIPNPYISVNGYVRVVSFRDSILYLGGAFTIANDDLGPHPRNGCAAYDLSSGRVTPFTADIDRGIVRAIAFSDNLIYIGGSFTKINGVARSRIAALDPATGTVATSYGSDTDKIDGPVYALAVSQGKLFAGGNFTRVNRMDRSYLAAFDAVTGELDTLFNPSPQDSMDIDGKMTGGVWAIAVHSDDPGILFVAGNFRTVLDGQGSSFLVALTTDGTLGPPFDEVSNSPICDLDCKNGRLYAGVGGFGNRVAAYDVTSSDWYTPLWKGFVVEGDVQAVTCSDQGFVYFSFHQGLIDTTDLYRCAVAEATTGCLYDTFPSISSFLGVLTLDVANGYLAAGGIFQDIGGVPHNYLAVFKEPSYTLPVLPPQVSLIDPSDSATGISPYPKLQWQFTAYAETYELQVATDERFKRCIITDSGINDLDKRISGLDDCTRYFWRVRARNRWGGGQWSTVYQFITEPGWDDVPVIEKPVEGIEQTGSFECAWHPVANALSYTVQVSEEWDFSTLLFCQQTGMDTTTWIAGLAPDSRYHLRIRALTAGGATDWTTASFSTLPDLPQIPTGMSPINQAMQIPCKPTVTWHAVTNAISYRVQLAVDAYFVGTIVDIAPVNDTFVVIPKLARETMYFWRVGAVNDAGESWSSPMQFTTEIPTPCPPIARLPFQGTAVSPDTVTIVWSGCGSDVTNYCIELSHDPAMAAPFAVVMTTDTIYRLRGLDDGIDVFWRVKAYNKSGAGPYSPTGIFSTVLSHTPQVLRTTFERIIFSQDYAYVRYSIARQCDVRIDIFDLKGNHVWRMKKRDVAPGRYSEPISVPGFSGGTYIVSMTAGGVVRKTGVTLVR